MKGRRFIFCTSAAAALLVGCSADNDVVRPGEMGVLRLTSSVESFVGEDGEAVPTRTNIDGNAFAEGDRIKLKIICPYTSHTNVGETTYGNTFDAFWLLKWKSGDWKMLEASDKVDVSASYRYSGAHNLFGQYEAQQTPYVYTASTWNENVLFMAGGNLQSQYTYLFRADQTLESDYLKSDLLWAQTYMQTGSYDVHLSFNHVMACLKIDISGLSLSANAVVTLEGMPNIDQREVVVGDYYAAKSKVNSAYGYKQKTSCGKDDNGKVLGVAFIEGASAVVKPMNGSGDVTNTGVYTAHKDGDYYYLIVPPCDLTPGYATLWVRDGEKRYSFQLDRQEFEQGKQYPVTLGLPPTPEP